MLTVEDIPRRFIKRVNRAHSQLRSEIRKVGRWPFKRTKLFVLCNCGWEDPEDIPILPVTGTMVTQYLARVRMERHIVAEAIKLGWKPRKAER